jgi:hypothetical protein
MIRAIGHDTVEPIAEASLAVGQQFGPIHDSVMFKVQFVPNAKVDRRSIDDRGHQKAIRFQILLSQWRRRAEVISSFACAPTFTERSQVAATGIRRVYFDA